MTETGKQLKLQEWPRIVLTIVVIAREENGDIYAAVAPATRTAGILT